jgi:hypothetical protein
MSGRTSPTAGGPPSQVASPRSQPKQSRTSDNQTIRRPSKHARPTSSNSNTDTPRKLSAQFLLDYERKGFCVTRGLLQPEQLVPVKECVKATIQQQRLQALKHRCDVSSS